MLQSADPVHFDGLPQKAEAYLHDTFDLAPHVEPYQPAGLPFYIADQYELSSADLFGRPAILMAPQPHVEIATAEMARQIELVRSRAETSLVILLLGALPHAQRRALIGRRIAFLVPGSQLFVPEALLDLRERAPRPAPRGPDLFSPTAQLVILGALLDGPAAHAHASATDLARRYGVAIMSMTRAFDEIEAAKIARPHRLGRKRGLTFEVFGSELWEQARARLQSPVRKVRTVTIPNSQNFPARIAGESALSAYTGLAPPRIQRLAVAASSWNQLARDHGLKETFARDPAGDEIETWSYAPGALTTDNRIVDRLSLYLSLRDHPDERVEKAAEDLIEAFPWS